MTPFEHDDLLAGAREIGGIHQPVMPAPDHNDVVFISVLPQARKDTYNRSP
jgi:hypothetical protein